MATKEELLPRLIRQQRSRQRVNTGEITALFSSASQDWKSRMDKALTNEKPTLIGSLVLELARSEKDAKATTAANQMLADNRLNLDELDQILP